MPRITLIFTAFMLFCHLALANPASFVARVDRSQIRIDDTLQLHLTITGDSPRERLDLSALLSNFDIVARSQSTQMTITNGNQFAQTEVIVRLAPKKTGKLTIPVITWGQYQSQAITIHIGEEITDTVQDKPSANTPNPKQDGEPLEKVFLEVDITPTSPYQDSQLLYKAKLYSAIPIHDGRITDPSGDNMWLYPEAAEERYEVIKNGHIYTVYERTYAIFPKTSGTLIIRSPRFSGNSFDNLFAGRMFNSPFENRKVDVKANAKKIIIKSKPDSQTATWLPAQELLLDEQWSQQPHDLKVGEPLERTLTLQAKGLTLSQLPDFTWDNAPGFKIYPGKVDTSENFDGKHIISKRTQKITYIPTQTGKLSIPEIRLPWFNAVVGQAETAKLIQRQLNITGTAAGTPSETKTLSNNTAPKPIVTPKKASPVKTTNQTDSPLVLATNPTLLKNNTITLDKKWLWFGLIGFVTTVSTLFLITRRRMSSHQQRTVTTEKSVGPTLQDIKKYAIAQQPQETRKALHEWLILNKKNQSKSAIAAIENQMQQLDNLLYSQNANATLWNGSAFWRELKNNLKK